MSSLITDQGSVHYEVYGRGRPVILLHGWLESWGLWQETMDFLGDSYRTYAIDFWGFGESDNRRETFTVPDFVILVNDFMDKLGIKHAPLIGHSMGGTVSLSVAINHPEKVSNGRTQAGHSNCRTDHNSRKSMAGHDSQGSEPCNDGIVPAQHFFPETNEFDLTACSNLPTGDGHVWRPGCDRESKPMEYFGYLPSARTYREVSKSRPFHHVGRTK